MFFFFLQAEDGIRDRNVTGVQTCALPISLIAAAARELQRLHDEFDFADAARTELDVIGELAPLHFALDEGLHLPQALEHAVVQIAAVDERPYGCRVDFRVTLGTGDRAGLDVRVPLPVAS